MPGQGPEGRCGCQLSHTPCYFGGKWSSGSWMRLKYVHLRQAETQGYSCCINVKTETLCGQALTAFDYSLPKQNTLLHICSPVYPLHNEKCSYMYPLLICSTSVAARWSEAALRFQKRKLNELQSEQSVTLKSLSKLGSQCHNRIHTVKMQLLHWETVGNTIWRLCCDCGDHTVQNLHQFINPAPL